MTISRRSLLAAGTAASLSLALRPETAHAASSAAAKPIAWQTTPLGRSQVYLADVAVHPSGVWTAGADVRSGFEAPLPYIARRTGGVWQTVPNPMRTPGSLSAIAVQSATHGWAVGEGSYGDSTRPIALRWNGHLWRQVALPFDFGGLSDVAFDASGGVWLTGWARLGNVEHAVVARFQAGRWTLITRGLEKYLNGNSLAVVSSTRVFVGLNGGLAKLSGSSWTPVPGLPTNGSLVVNGFGIRSAKDIWMTGLQYETTGPRATVRHWTGGKWISVPVPTMGFTQMYDIAVGDQGPMAVGEEMIDHPDGSIETKPVVLTHDGTRMVRRPFVSPSSTVTGVGILGTRVWATAFESTTYEPVIATAART